MNFFYTYRKSALQDDAQGKHCILRNFCKRCTTCDLLFDTSSISNAFLLCCGIRG